MFSISQQDSPRQTRYLIINYMNQEFNLAYNLARSGYKRHKYPPGSVPVTSQTAPGLHG